MSEVEGGFPHSEMSGSKPVRGSPNLIAAYHVLHRLSAPRHPPNTLKALDRSHEQCPPSLPRSAAVVARILAIRTPWKVAANIVRKTSFCLPNTSGCQGGQARQLCSARTLGGVSRAPNMFSLYDVKVFLSIGSRPSLRTCVRSKRESHAG